MQRCLLLLLIGLGGLTTSCREKNKDTPEPLLPVEGKWFIHSQVFYRRDAAGHLVSQQRYRPLGTFLNNLPMVVAASTIERFHTTSRLYLDVLTYSRQGNTLTITIPSYTSATTQERTVVPSPADSLFLQYRSAPQPDGSSITAEDHYFHFH